MGLLASLGSAAIQAVSDNLSASSEWGSLHPNLIAVISPCGIDGTVTGMGIKAPLKDGTFQQQFNWQSPYEGMSNDVKNPALSAAMLSERAGQVLTALNSVNGVVQGSVGQEGGASDGVADLMSMATSAVKGFEELMHKAAGRSGITKMNSRQVFSGHEPLRLSFTLVFRAYQDPISEVEQPVQKLLSMAFPAKIANDYVTDGLNTVQSDDSNIDKALKVLFPSEAPTCVSFRYKGVSYAPMVIEDISFPLDAPSSPMGDVFKEVQVTLGTLYSVDGNDLAKFRSGAIGSIVGNVVGEAVNAVTSLFK